MIAHAGIDEDSVMARAQEKRLNGHDEVSASRVQRARLHPGPMPLPVVGRAPGKEAQRFEPGADRLDDALDDDLTERVLFHGAFSLESK
jgi:hypothetical protein